MTEWYFVWVEGLRGPMPQKWSSDGLWGQVGRQDVIVRFALSDGEEITELGDALTGDSRRAVAPRVPQSSARHSQEHFFLRNIAKLISLPG